MIKRILREELQSEMKDLSKIKVGTDEHKAAVESIVKLMDKYNELEKLDLEAEQRDKDREHDKCFKQQQLDQEKKDNRWKNRITIAGIAVPAVLTVWGTFKTIKFEETGTITTIMGRGFVQKLLPKK